MPENKKTFMDRLVEWVADNINIRAVVNLLGTFTGFLYGELDERLELQEAVKKQMRKPIPGHASGWHACFGGITLLLFMIQVVTGVLLAIYYRPTTGAAHESILFIMNEVQYGWLIRSVHRYAAELMVLTVFIHMVKVPAPLFNDGVRFYGLPLAVGPARLLGHDGRDRDGQFGSARRALSRVNAQGR
jgi:hypothetical protein